MTLNQKFLQYFLVAGFLGGVGGTVFLWQYVGPDHSYLVVGLRERWMLLAFPFVGAFLSGFWAVCLIAPGFGAKRGATVGLLAFLTFNLILALLGPAGFQGEFVNGIGGLLGIVFSYTFFGFIIFASLEKYVGSFRYR